MKKNKINYNNTIKIIIIIFIQYFFFTSSKKYLKNIQKILINKNGKITNNSYNLSEVFSKTKIAFNITSITYSLSFKFNIVKVEYNISFYDSGQHLIIPSDLTLFYKLHIFCIITEINQNWNIISLANIYKNTYFSCVEYINMKEKINFGIRIYLTKNYSIKHYSVFFFKEKILNFNSYIVRNDNEYNPLIIKNELNNNINKKHILDNTNKFLKLEAAFYDNPNYCFKSNISKNNSIWYFKNIYNHYFCFCKFFENSECLYESIPKKCKYMFYLYIIDNNKLLFNKTHYLFADFSSPFNAPGESYYIFKEMIKQNLNAHYLTKRKELFQIYYNKNSSIKNKLPIIYFEYIDGNFLEKYLNLFLKLKSVISGASISSMSNLFKQIDYITYICLGHGISYLKDFLYKDYYGSRYYNKIVLPPSKLIIFNAKKYGWDNNNIIKIGLPRWDIFYEYEKNLNNKNTNLNQSIFIMFTWRVNKNKQNISKYYFKNIKNLINDYYLYQLLKLNNITLNFAIHDNFEKYKNIFQINKYIKYINQNHIIDCLKQSSLVITDFSSIIFDFIARKKPYIIYIPDAEDSKISEIYSRNYYNVINRMKNGILNFENIFFQINETINKIQFYINNSFKLDIKLKIFYQKFNFQNKGNNIKKFVNYLKKLK